MKKIPENFSLKDLLSSNELSLLKKFGLKKFELLKTKPVDSKNQ